MESACEGSALVRDKNVCTFLAETETRKSDAWQQKVDCNVPLSEAAKSRLVLMFCIRTDVA